MRFPASPLLAALILATTASCERGSADTLQPWQVVDPAFTGCEGG